ncbi:hypothetical protein Glove_413g17 [Diversispora epigaea]|uniref:Uncharacterized protein n=1 Tax=Diversispora epigaea TaxID=1348612 RepID=A0A397GY85_9GLOM|nr:hypothetical protein Glove_413g17 [Diversispora epigaea]
MKERLCYGYCLSCSWYGLPEKTTDCPVNCFRIEDELGLFFPILSVQCLECGYFFNYLSTNGLVHNTNCSVVPKYSKRHAVEIIQRRFRSPEVARKLYYGKKSPPNWYGLPEKTTDCPVNCFRIEDELGLFFPILSVHCLECGYFFDYLSTNGLVHNTNCSVVPKYSKRHAVEIIQRRFRSWMKIRTNSAKIIQRVVVSWLYHPNGPIAKKASNQYYGLATSQAKSLTDCGC